jgi:heme O synthase-like polyprenyltransferase
MLFKEVKGSEKSLFLYSIFYLTIVFAGICLDKFILNYY